MYDAIVVGSGLGGSLAAHRLVRAGWRVLLLERGEPVLRGPQCAEPSATLEFMPCRDSQSAYRVKSDGRSGSVASASCLGGLSVFFGAAALRWREADFVADSESAGSSGACWPFRYTDLEPYYVEAERLLGVAGDDATDPTRPPRSAPFPQQPAPLFAVSERLRHAILDAGATPTPLPLAINYDSTNGRKACTFCRHCDTFACATGAKNDVEIAVLSPIMGRGLDVRTGAVVTRIEVANGQATGVSGWDKTSQRPFEYTARHVVVAAGALASPHLLLASGLDRLHPSGRAIGRFLTRHCSAIVEGFCNFRPDPEKVFHKQLIVLDYYFGDPRARKGAGQPLGSIQQLTTPPHLLMKAHLPWFPKRVPLHGFVEHLSGLLVMAEDEPQACNGVTVDRSDPDPYGMPRLHVSHRYSRRDLERRRLLVRKAKRILRREGAWSFYTLDIETFSHALGTVRMGSDGTAAPLDADCRLRGLRNLLVVDGSALPTSAAVNPGLTIAANALRAADRLIQADSR